VSCSDKYKLISGAFNSFNSSSVVILSNIDGGNDVDAKPTFGSVPNKTE
ncbi:unnamed protein product, partial [Rotaria sp. Silwood2]